MRRRLLLLGRGIAALRWRILRGIRLLSWWRWVLRCSVRLRVSLCRRVSVRWVARRLVAGWRGWITRWRVGQQKSPVEDGMIEGRNIVHPRKLTIRLPWEPISP